MRLVVAARPSIFTFALFRLMREVSSRLVIPSRNAMFGDYVGRGSTDYIMINQLMQQVAQISRSVCGPALFPGTVIPFSAR